MPRLDDFTDAAFRNWAYLRSDFPESGLVLLFTISPKELWAAVRQMKSAPQFPLGSRQIRKTDGV
jgi:hypothetical protein